MSLLFFVALICGASPLAAAEDGATEAEALVKEGIQLRRLGNDDAALAKFQRAFAISATPRNAAQLGLCEQAMGRSAAAEKHLGVALQAVSDPWVTKHRAILRESLEKAKTNVVRLDFFGGPPGASVAVNGEEVGKLPLADTVKAIAGQVHVVVTADGYNRWATTLALAGGQYQRVVIEMTETARKPLAMKTSEKAQQSLLPAENQTSDAALQSAAVPASASTEGASPSVWRSPWLWGGVAAVVIGVAITAVVLSSGSDSSGGSCPSGVDICATR